MGGTDTSLLIWILLAFLLMVLLSRRISKFKELEFQAFVKQFQSNAPDTSYNVNSPKKVYQTIMDIEELDQLIIDLKKSELISMDLETTSLIPLQAEIVGFSFSISEHEGWYVPIMYLEKEKNNFGHDDLEVVLDRVNLKSGKAINFCLATTISMHK